MIVEIRIPELLDLQTKSKVEEVDDVAKLVTTITLKAVLPPVALARLHNILALGGKLEAHFCCPQAVRDLTLPDYKGNMVPVENERTYQKITTHDGQPKLTADQWLEKTIAVDRTG